MSVYHLLTPSPFNMCINIYFQFLQELVAISGVSSLWLPAHAGKFTTILANIFASQIVPPGTQFAQALFADESSTDKWRNKELENCMFNRNKWYSTHRQVKYMPLQIDHELHKSFP